MPWTIGVARFSSRGGKSTGQLSSNEVINSPIAFFFVHSKPKILFFNSLKQPNFALFIKLEITESLIKFTSPSTKMSE